MNDRGWLARTYEEHKTGLLRSAWNILHDFAEAEDAVHAAFVKMAKLAEAPTDDKLYAYKAVRHTALNMARANRRQPIRESLRDHDASDDAKPQLDIEQDAELEGAMNALSPENRELIELHLHSGLTFREMGELMNAPTQTIASRYRRSISVIRNQIIGKRNGRG